MKEAHMNQSPKFKPIFALLPKTSTIIAALSWTFASSAWALIDAQVEVGARSGTFEAAGGSKTLNATTIEAAGHLDPIPLVPVSFGLRLISDTYQATTESHGVKSLTSYSVAPEVTAWFPFGDLKPFARLGYTVFSQYTGTATVGTTDGTVKFKSMGLRVAAGVEWDLLPLISLTGAVERSSEKLSMTSGTINGFDIKASSTDTNYNNNALLVGVKVGL
jgi:Outer membrane protein beta-barrel domain